jgi:hypothetical protein
MVKTARLFTAAPFLFGDFLRNNTLFLPWGMCAPRSWGIVVNVTKN